MGFVVDAARHVKELMEAPADKLVSFKPVQAARWR